MRAPHYSDAQRRFIWRLYRKGGDERAPFGGGRNTGREASAWYRTVTALAVDGLVKLEREGDAYRAFLLVDPKLVQALGPDPEGGAA